MKRIFFVLMILTCASASFGATRPSATPSQPTTQRVSRTGMNATGTPPASNNSARTVASRSATIQPTQPTTPQVSRSARAAVPPQTQQGRAAKQSVISTGTKVATATENTAVDQVCWGKFSGCMDSFCMLDNTSGGRCICSDKNAEYDAILEEIQKLDEQSYQLATVGVERIEMGDAVDAVMSKTDSVTKRVTADAAKSKRQSLDLSSWNSLDLDFDADVEDIFDISSDGVSVNNKTGDALYRAASKLCNAQIPECKSQSTLMDLMYKQRVRSDCTAYENSLRAARTQSAQKLAAAQSAMREAALEQYRNANKYDLGQCTVQFKQCMQTTGGCGDDFTGCVGSIQEVTTGVKFDSLKKKKIKGNSSSITIAQSTYDILEAKKPLCMTVTQECVNVRDQVWDAFLREAAPQIKSAELSAESDMRTSCISNISNCFQKACRDTMDPNDPEGSYDMCLVNPDIVSNLCKIQVTPCENSIPGIMTYVKARLKSMRVDSCTNEFKACLQSEDRCGEDYTQCIGLDTDTIVRMCPADKLVGCQDETHNANYVYQNLADIAKGIFLNIDNNLLAACQKAVRNKVIEVCGSLSECEAFDDDTVIGTDSLVRYKTGDKIVIDGLMNFGLLTFDDSYLSNNTNQPNTTETPIFDRSAFNFLDNPASDVDTATANRIRSAINTVENSAVQKINILNTDPTIETCIKGLTQSWRKDGDPMQREENVARFPHLLESYTRMVFNSALNKAYLNYNEKYNKLVGEAMEDQSDDVKAALCAAMSYQEGAAVCTEHEEVDGEAVCKKYRTNLALESIFNNNAGDMGLRGSGTRYELQASDLSKKLQTMSKGKGEFIQVDKEGNMIGWITMESMYSSGTNICTLKTTSKLCSEMEMKITTDTTYCETAGLGGGCSTWEGAVAPTIGYADTTYKKENYHGIYCSEYGEPVTNVQEIKM